MKSKEEIYFVLKNILIEDFEIEKDVISLDAKLYEDLDLDSIDAVDLIVKMKEITGKKMNPELFKEVRTISDVVDAIEITLK